MNSERFGCAIRLTDHANKRMVERDIDEARILDLIETGQVKLKWLSWKRVKPGCYRRCWTRERPPESGPQRMSKDAGSPGHCVRRPCSGDSILWFSVIPPSIE